MSVCVSVDEGTDYGPFLTLFRTEPEVLSAITVTQVLKAFSPTPEYVPAYRLVSEIGSAVEQEFKHKLMKNPRYRQRVSVWTWSELTDDGNNE